MGKGQYKIVRGGLLLDIDARRCAAADILVDGDAISEIGPPGLAAPDGAIEIDAADRLLIPGLVNAHTHGHGALGKGLGDKWSLELMLHNNPWVSGGFTQDDMQAAATLNAAEMVLKGCTAAYDMMFEFPHPTTDGIGGVAQAYADVGVRATIAPMMGDRTLYEAIPGLLDAFPAPHRDKLAQMAATPYRTHVAQCDALIRDWPFDRDVVRPALGPTIPIHCSDDFIVACDRLARDYGVRVQTHLGESKIQSVSARERYGMTMAAHLDRLGVLGPHLTGAHGVWLTDDDIKRLADAGTSIAHNPGSNLRLGSGIARAREMRDGGVTVGIGSDGGASSDNQNMFEAMRFAAFVSRVSTPDPETWLGTWEVLEMATQGGAQLLGMEDKIGRLAPGFKADIVFLDLGNVNFLPLNDAANQIVNCEDLSAVHTVMIGGEIVLENRQFTKLDFAALRRRVTEAAHDLTERNRVARDAFEPLTQYVCAHCTGLLARDFPVRRRLNDG